MCEVSTPHRGYMTNKKQIGETGAFWVILTGKLGKIDDSKPVIVFFIPLGLDQYLQNHSKILSVTISVNFHCQVASQTKAGPLFQRSLNQMLLPEPEMTGFSVDQWLLVTDSKGLGL